MTDYTRPDPNAAVTKEDFKVIAASSVGSVFEWLDFFLYGSLAVILSKHFFSGVDADTAFMLALLAFGAGFAVRPFGAIVFGHLGDLWGRKNTFIVTLLIMGAATVSVGLLPTYEQIGPAAAWILVAMRMLQGLSVGGVYGGAATYVAEHAPDNRRGFYTSWIQITATVGMALSLSIIFVTRTIMGEEAFADWGWRIPFVGSSLFLGITIWIQLKLNESPVYLKMKASGKGAKAPLKEAFGNWANVKVILIALFGAIVGQAVVWYAAQFYTLFFLERHLKVDSATANLLIAAALVISTPLYIFFGWLSDKVGRKPVMMAACLIAALTYFPLFKALTAAANPAMAQAAASAPATVYADPNDCSFMFDPIGGKVFSTSCDIAKSFLTRTGVTYSTVDAPAGTVAELRIGDKSQPSFRGNELSADDLKTQRAEFEKAAAAMVTEAGYPAKADPEQVNIPLVLLILVAMMSLAAMVYGPMAALLVELFPAHIRYTSMSLPYHIGVGWTGGFLPFVAFAIVAETGSIYSGLWYPTIFATFTFVVGMIFLPQTHKRQIH